MTKSVTKSKSTSESALHTGLVGNGDQVTALQGPNQRGGNMKKEQRKKAPAMSKKITSPLEKRVTIEEVQTKLSSLLPSTSSSTFSPPTVTKPLSFNVESGVKREVSQAPKYNLAKSEENIQRQRIVNSPNTKPRNSQQKNVASPAKCVIALKSLPKKGKGKGKGKDPEEHSLQKTIPSPHRLNENNLSIFHLPTTTSTPPSTSSPPKSTKLLSKPPPKHEPQSKKHRALTLTTSLPPSLPPSLPLPLTSPSPSLIPVAPKLLKRFYEALILLTVFGSNRGSRILEEETPTDSFDDDILDIDMKTSALDVNKKQEMDEMSRTKLRRSFTRHLAYLCDYEKGGDSTTAIALQQMDTGRIIYHVAWNKCSRPERGVEFLEKVLGLLGCAGYDGVKDFEKDKEDIEGKIFELSVKYAEKRISSYAFFLARDIRFVLGEWKTVREDDQDEESSTRLHTWLQGLLTLTEHPSQLCRFCHKTSAAAPQEFTHLQLLIQSGSPFATRFTQIRHTIGRLNHTPKAIQILLSTRNLLPQLFTQLAISHLPSSSSSPPPLQARNPTLSALIGRTMSDPLAITSYRAALAEMDHKYQLSTHLSSHCTNPNWRPKIHAEAGGWKPDSWTEISEVRGRETGGGRSFVGDEMRGVGGDGVEDEDCESAVGDEEEYCDSAVGEYNDEEEEEEEEEEEGDERIIKTHHARNESSDLSQANRENEATSHQQNQSQDTPEANYPYDDTSEEEEGGVYL
ncbi:uncharacterized protein Bfra_001835 [Botrytis fragariae]|uniref:Uncharacterized protein n=1 Tax=Botrytis fragariae TaxID=1964551 RepID=A0A8H6B1L2_9HELO|nr:uncharacterized protein Bfra_001835 [Botrytis fragariae]KAF5877468.1 hypothetical protein Bfra_001835 [Botrytis fragariae]